MDPQIQDLQLRVGNLEQSSIVRPVQIGDIVPIQYTDIQGSVVYAAVATITLTSAQILALNTTPIKLIPAPNTLTTAGGIASVIIVEGITVKNTFNSIAYTGINNLEFRYTDGSGVKVTADIASTFINSASTAYNHVAGIITSFTPATNAPIVVVVPTANPGAGNGNLTFLIKYRIISI